jgi:hypothetical protein
MMIFAKRLFNIKSILAVFIALGVLYSIATPIFEASDEVSHYAMIQNISDGYGLPVQQPGARTAWEQEGSQPPLYYLLMSAATKWIDTSDAADRMYHNPHAAPGDPSLDANRNLVIHSIAENFPWRQTTLAVHLIRLMSIGLGALTVLLGYKIARRIFPDRPSIALGAASLIAFNPMFLFITASVNNDNLTILLASLTIYTLIQCWQEPSDVTLRSMWWRRIILGSIIGLAALSKISGLTLLPIVGLGLTVRHLRRREWRTWLFSGLIMVVAVAAIAGWWYWRNQQLYGEWLGLNTMVTIAGPRPFLLTPAQLIAEFDGFRYSFWALFGAVNILTVPIAYSIFDAVSLLAVIGCVVWLIKFICHANRDQVFLLALLALYIGIVFVGVINWTLMTPASQGRLLFPAITAIALLMWLGWDTLWSLLRDRWQSGRWLLPAFLFFIAMISPFQAILPTYAPPAVLTVDTLPIDLQRLDVDYGQTLRLLGYTLPASASNARSISFTLYWQCLTRPIADYSVFVIAYGRGLTEIGKRDAYPHHGQYATRECEPGEIFVDAYQQTIDPSAARPTIVQMQIGLKDWNTNVELKPASGDRILPALLFIAGKIPPPIDPQTAAFDLARFGDSLALNRVDVPTESQAGETLPIHLYWRVLSAVPESFTVFVHLIDASGNTVVQSDGVPVDNAYPTQWWSSGEIIDDQHIISLKPDLPSGPYRVAIGLYRLADGTRLPIVNTAGQLQPDSQFILSNVIQVTK